MDYGTAIAAAASDRLPSAGVAQSGQKGLPFFAGDPPPTDLWELRGGRECGDPRSVVKFRKGHTLFARSSLDKPGLWAHVLSKERTLGYIATAGDGLRTHLRDLACDLDSQTLASHAYQSCAYGTLGEGATP